MKKPDFIMLYGRKYARTNAAFIDSLFHKSGTCNGLFSIECGGIIFKDMNGEDVAYIRKDGLGPVTVSTDRPRRYMFGLGSRAETFLGTPESYMATVEGAKQLAHEIFTTN